MTSLGAFELELAIEPSQVPAGIKVKKIDVLNGLNLSSGFVEI
jgi:hypothetical protein